MGGYRSSPQLTKLSIAESKENTRYAIKQMCGWRKYLQDAFIAEDQLAKNQRCSLFGIFDGHGGADVAIFVSRHFSQQFQRHPDFKKNQYSRCLRDTFFKLDEMMQTQQGKKQLMQIQSQQFSKENSQKQKNLQGAGSTGLVVLITSLYIYVANAGDCRAICSKNGNVVQMSTDHNASNDKEIKRVLQAGGYIQKGRINGDLTVSRGFGDFSFKKNKYQKLQNQIITVQPEITQFKKDNLDYILLGCDGIWETKSSLQMKNWIDKQLPPNAKQQEMSQALEILLDELVSKDKQGPKGMDNMTVMLIKLNHQ